VFYSIRQVFIVAAVLVPLAGLPSTAIAQDTGNDLPNPYQAVSGWAKMPGARHWGSTSAVDIDPDGVHIWVAERCGQNACEGSTLDTVLKFDSSGQLVKSFGAGKMNWPHGIHVDTEGNVWVTDARGGNGKGHQVHKFSPDGDVLLSLGTAGEAGNDATHFNQPSDVVVGPDGSIYVGDGHGGTRSRQRVVKFDANGNFIKDWGETGTGPDQMGVPHALAFDSQGRLFVADRSNNRILIYDQEGTLLDTWYQFSRNSGIFIDADDMLYATDSESSDSRNHGEWKRGIRIGSARTGEVMYFIPDPADANDGPLRGTSFSEGVAVDAAGNIYGAEVGPRDLKRYERRPDQ
jgi:DNA-binding beta-propeller fold protein YncE